MTYETILVEKNSGIGTIKLNRAEVLNALSTVLVKEVDQA
ncbi:MAG: enoyl-CoA hydratase, partial [Flavobacteriales bacterium]|nr:enoyl-CoA hydratase [Flavobacteriales bacterium]